MKKLKVTAALLFLVTLAVTVVAQIPRELSNRGAAIGTQLCGAAVFTSNQTVICYLERSKNNFEVMRRIGKVVTSGAAPRVAVTIQDANDVEDTTFLPWRTLKTFAADSVVGTGFFTFFGGRPDSVVTVAAVGKYIRAVITTSTVGAGDTIGCKVYFTEW